MTIYYESARDQITTNSKVIRAVLAVVNPLLGKINTAHTAKLFASHAGNVTAVQAALLCRGCLSSPFEADEVGLHAFDIVAATRLKMVGLIFVSYNYLIVAPIHPKYA